jgi:hypothetical protein
MTEAEWLAATDTSQMLLFLGDRASEPKLRLFGCACCRRIPDWPHDRRSQKVVEVAEQYADGLTDEPSLSVARDVRCVCRGVAKRHGLQAARSGKAAALQTAWEKVAEGDGHRLTAANDACERERAVQAVLFRDIFLNPFHLPPEFSPTGRAWKECTVVKLAAAIYADRAFDRLPLLADALEDAGCTDAELLGHLRGPGPHVRGCWALDLVLGRS